MLFNVGMKEFRWPKHAFLLCSSAISPLPHSVLSLTVLGITHLVSVSKQLLTKQLFAPQMHHRLLCLIWPWFVHKPARSVEKKKKGMLLSKIYSSYIKAFFSQMDIFSYFSILMPSSCFQQRENPSHLLILSHLSLKRKWVRQQTHQQPSLFEINLVPWFSALPPFNHLSV